MSSDSKLTVGTAVDQIISALSGFAENDRQAILLAACTHLGIDLHHTLNVPKRPTGEAHSSHDPVERAAVTRAPGHPSLDIRSLKDEKHPNSARQMACLVAYYLQEVAPENERKDTITVSDLEKYFKQASYKLPAKLEQLLVDTKAAGYFDSHKRGEYVLTRVGYNLVAHGMSAKSKA